MTLPDEAAAARPADGEWTDAGRVGATAAASEPSRDRADAESGSREAHSRLLADLRDQRADIEAAILARVNAIAIPREAEDVRYRSSTPAVVSACVEYCLCLFEAAAAERDVSVPAALAEQARRAARSGIGAEVMIDRLIAGHRQLSRLVEETATRLQIDGQAELIEELGRTQETVLERFAAAVAEEHGVERERIARTREQRRLELVRRLLAGEEVAAEELHYDFGESSWHLAVVATGPDSQGRLGALAARLGLKLLTVWRDDDTLWAWLGATRELPMENIEELLGSEEFQSASYAVGAPRRGLEGWRESHELARAIQLVAGRSEDGVTRCPDAILEAALLAHPALARALVDSYLRPLDTLRMGGETARATLRAYLACERSVSSAAHRLGVSRQALEKRLAQIDASLGRRVATCVAELELSLRLETLGVVTIT